MTSVAGLQFEFSWRTSSIQSSHPSGLSTQRRLQIDDLRQSRQAIVDQRHLGGAATILSFKDVS